MKIKKYIPAVITVFLALLIVVVSFTPLVIPANAYHPQIFGLPYSLWMGILVTAALVFLTWVATRIHPGARAQRKKEKDNQQRTGP